MKVSFYFMLWILIYPALDLLSIQLVTDNSFVIALIVIYAISWATGRYMTDINAYEKIVHHAPILEDVHNTDVVSLRKRIKKDFIVDLIIAIYLIVTIVFLILLMVSGVSYDWFAMIVFAFFTYGSITQAYLQVKALKQLKENASQEQCENVVGYVYNLDYSAYKSDREQFSYKKIITYRPVHYKAYMIISAIIAVICILLGITHICLASNIFYYSSDATAASAATMILLYGALATKFGIKDIMDCYSKRKFVTNNHQ